MRKLFLLLVILFFVKLGFTQEQILEETSKKVSYLIKYDPYARDENQRILNAMIEEIAKMPYKNKFSTEITYSYIQHTKITKKGNTITTYLDIKNLNCFGDIFYKEFNLIDVIMPEMFRINGFLSGWNRNDPHKMLAEYDLPASDLNPIKNTFVFSFKDTMNHDHYSFQVKNADFIYTEKSKRRFFDRLDLIDNYYKTVLNLEKFYRDVEKINPDDIDQLSYSQNMLENAHNFIQETEKYDLPHHLDLEFFDPLDFVKNFNEFKNLSYHLAQGINNTLSKLHEIYYNKGLEFIVNKNNQMARNMFMKSLDINPSFAPALYQLARIDMLEGNYDAAAEKIKDLFNKLNPDQNTYSFGMELAKNLFDAYLASGDNLYAGKKYPEALDVYLKTDLFCRSVRGFKCPDVLSRKISLARIGIYNTYLENARRFIQQGNLELAEKEVNNAFGLQANYPSDIKDNGAANMLLTNIKQIEYKNNITEGKNYMTAKNYQAALTSFQKAEVLEKTYPITKSQELLSLLKSAVKPVILADLNEGFELANKNQLQQARNIVNNSISLQNTYGLGDDKAINKLINTLKTRIFSQECMNAQNEFDQYLINAKQYMTEKKDFTSADREFGKAEQLITMNASCGIDRKSLDSTRLSVLPAITYQKVIYEMYGFLNSKYYEKALTRYMDAESHFYQLHVERFGLTHLPLLDFIKSEENGFILYSINYFLNKDDPDKSLTLIYELKNRNVKSRKLKNELTLLGTKLAIRDMKAGNKLPPKQAVILYTNNDSWFKKLYKAYIKVFK